MLPQLNYENLSPTHHYVIDVRSPGEYKEFHLPNGYHLPLFTDEERSYIGTIYKQENPERAKERGLAIYAGKLEGLYGDWKKLKAENKGKKAVVVCARGGMRSASFVSMMNTVGIEAYQLTGGIRSVRENIRKKLDDFSRIPWKGTVLSGNTGVGKTKWLKKLKDKGYPVVDIEGLANHRGSVFGHIGLQPHSQKQFEYELVKTLQEYEKGQCIILESESKRIGTVILPPFLLKLKEDFLHLELTDTLETRVYRLIEEYTPANCHEEILQAYGYIRKRIPQAITEKVDTAFEAKDYSVAFTLLLSHYYDPKYEYKGKQYGHVVSIHLAEANDEENLQRMEEIINREIKCF
ncbi:MAG: tRNA 2-selenouridine(34) synthase MnmH [Bacillus sp. (in: Bacteria)]|nr:tRNA 2-selenouridine(34) synthase MnmH [Bacillus sp. (in: firmicutes)]